MPRGRFASRSARTARGVLIATLLLGCLALAACGERAAPQDGTERLTGDNGSVLDTSADARELRAAARKLRSDVEALPRSVDAPPLGPIAPPPPVVPPPTPPPATTTNPATTPPSTVPPPPTSPPPFVATVDAKSVTCAAGVLSFLVDTNYLDRLRGAPGVLKVVGVSTDFVLTATIVNKQVRIDASDVPAGTNAAEWHPKDLGKVDVKIEPACT